VGETYFMNLRKSLILKVFNEKQTIKINVMEICAWSKMWSTWSKQKPGLVPGLFFNSLSFLLLAASPARFQPQNIV
jgi:hypothetical protein